LKGESVSTERGNILEQRDGDSRDFCADAIAGQDSDGRLHNETLPVGL
jgi:hypothetical protein